ncbi:unnamed protein product [Rotaria socialis]|uniref:Uncharacterized protein n=1 Tax=Rotaria socialis TaxID=392032 RepID=A0A820NWE8_9BILA|nr:unnamed protein product [Rotaria socialis]CAF3372961.1 unnamed protein product [Rotaria socialis]CAF3468489.1 unnamed protein product [Rotaria socialis]CAF3589234.1 unnamed protein product [Rotaria socialis]CAF3613639.1 unnamed protein product [Rotaria socialis]
MELTNRFEPLNLLSINEESVDSCFVDETSSNEKVKVTDEQLTNNCWNIPDYVEKRIPCSPIHISKKETYYSIKRKQSSINTKIIRENNKDKLLPTVEIEDQPTTTYSYYPPQPYKFKQNRSYQHNQTMPKFNQRSNVLPKHTSPRGNSKACTHQI